MAKQNRPPPEKNEMLRRNLQIRLANIRIFRFHQNDNRKHENGNRDNRRRNDLRRRPDTSFYNSVARGKTADIVYEMQCDGAINVTREVQRGRAHSADKERIADLHDDGTYRRAAE